MTESVPVVLSEEELERITGGANTSSGNGLGFDPGSPGMDVETMMLMVQGQRSEQLDQQLQQQIADVQERNQRIAELNDFQNVLNDARDRLNDGSDGTGGYISLDERTDPGNPDSPSFGERFQELGMVGDTDGDGRIDGNELDSAIDTLNQAIEAESNSQQMDVLRLQSLNERRNDASDVMNEFIRKMQDNRQSIINNMR